MRRFTVLFLTLLLGLVISCGGGVTNTNVTKENYNKIKKKMTLQQVKQIVGEADSVTETDAPGMGKMELWHYQLGNTAIDVTFIKGKVYTKSWVSI